MDQAEFQHDDLSYQNREDAGYNAAYNAECHYTRRTGPPLVLIDQLRNFYFDGLAATRHLVYCYLVFRACYEFGDVPSLPGKNPPAISNPNAVP
jgi:hypothetical protein